MRHFLLAVFLVVACATVAAVGSIGEAKSAFGRGDYAMAAQIEKAQEMARRCHQSKFKECD